MSLLGDAASAVSQFKPGQIFSGGLPDLPGRLGSGSFAIEPLSSIPNPSVIVERAFLLAKSRFLPSWLSISVPIDNAQSPLDSLYIGSDGKPTPGTEASTTARKNLYSTATGYVRPTKYMVHIGPTKMTIPNFLPRDVGYSCSTATLPGMALSTFEIRQDKAHQTKRPYDKTFDAVNLTFQVSNDMKERKMFESWINAIYDIDKNTFEYPENYFSSIKIKQLSNDKNILRTVELIDAYPTNMSAITLSYDTENTIETFEVQFAYTNWIAS